MMFPRPTHVPAVALRKRAVAFLKTKRAFEFDRAVAFVTLVLVVLAFAVEDMDVRATCVRAWAFVDLAGMAAHVLLAGGDMRVAASRFGALLTAMFLLKAVNREEWPLERAGAAAAVQVAVIFIVDSISLQKAYDEALKNKETHGRTAPEVADDDDDDDEVYVTRFSGELPEWPQPAAGVFELSDDDDEAADALGTSPA